LAVNEPGANVQGCKGNMIPFLQTSNPRLQHCFAFLVQP
jgi:hypothetical protein